MWLMRLGYGACLYAVRGLGWVTTDSGSRVQAQVILMNHDDCTYYNRIKSLSRFSHFARRIVLSVPKPWPSAGDGNSVKFIAQLNFVHGVLKMCDRCLVTKEQTDVVHMAYVLLCVVSWPWSRLQCPLLLAAWDNLTYPDLCTFGRSVHRIAKYRYQLILCFFFFFSLASRPPWFSLSLPFQGFLITHTDTR
jgi:hypothetical protein